MGQKRYLHLLRTFTLLSCAVGCYAPAAYAEGSNDIVNNGGNRPYLEFRNDTNGGIPRRTIVKVYANEGETIELGSSAVGLGSGVINYRDPNNVAGSCGINGLIANRTEEAAGPGDGTGNTFVPCTVAVGAGQNGIWEIDFVSPNPGSGGNPPPTAATDPWTQANNGIVPAWDATVRSATDTKIPGRVYANYYSFNMGSNGVSLNSIFTVLTREGYQYQMNLNGIDPFGFIFFANRNGFFDTTTGDSIFRSLQFVGSNPGSLPPGYAFHNPNDPDVGIYVTHKTFINPPDSSMPASANSPTGSTWLYTLPAPPPVPTGFGFVGVEGTTGQAGTAPLGGNLVFNSPSQTAYSITLDIDQNGIFGDPIDRTFVGRAVVGANSVFWDGIDGQGNPVPASTTPYNVRINLYAGEAHFPIIDAEQNPRGFKLQRLNTPAGLPATGINDIYYDDRNTGSDFTLCAAGEGTGCYGGPPTPREALTGVSSDVGPTTGGHAFTSNFGNIRGIDTWVYYPSADVDLSGGIIIREADLIVDKVVDLATANPGDTLEYTITVTNDGPSDEAGIGFQDTVPATLTGVAWSCSITSGTGNCGAPSGTGNSINTTLDLNNQAVATYVVTGTLSASASGTITNSATATRNLDITDPDLSNNTDDAVTTINSIPPPIGAFCYLVANSNNQLVQVDINTGAEASVGPVGTGGDIRAIAYLNSTNQLFIANDTELGIYNTATDSYSAIGDFGNVGPETPASVDGLAFHPYTGELYGTARNSSGSDSLIKVNPTTGAFIPNAFGAGIDFLTITTSNSQDIGDIAFDPDTGELYGLANGSGSNADQLVRINTTNGSTTAVGSVGINNMEGLAVFNDGSFYGSTGNSSQPAGDRNQFYSVNKGTGAAAAVGGGLSIGTGYESIACATEAENSITGTVFLDPDTSSTFNAGDSGTANATVRLYRDANGNGTVDGSDPLLASQLSSGPGTFTFTFPANGAFVLDIDTATLPANNNILTTDNVESANFGSSFGLTDPNNNFGHFTDSNLAIVKRITAINGTTLTDSVDNPGDTNDNHPNWPLGTSGAGISTFLAGATERAVEPGDEVEYTIYYLATGNFPVTNVELCDRVPAGATYIPNSLVIFSNGGTSDLTDLADGDAGEFVASGTATPGIPCPSTNTNGTAIVNLAPSPTQLPNATGPGTPTNAYGFIRFRVTVD